LVALVIQPLTAPSVEGADEPGWWLPRIGFLNHSGRLENVTHPPIPIHNIRIRLETKRPVECITSLANSEALDGVEQSDAAVEVVLPCLEAFEVKLVEYAD